MDANFNLIQILRPHSSSFTQRQVNGYDCRFTENEKVLQATDFVSRSKYTERSISRRAEVGLGYSARQWKKCVVDRLSRVKRGRSIGTKRKEKLILHSEASGTLASMDVLKDLGMPIPKELIDTLFANEAKFMREMEEVIVEVILEQDLILPRFPGLEASQSLDQSD
ncbi:hypothetical protein Bca101_060362 [Brassica carinata]